MRSAETAGYQRPWISFLRRFAQEMAQPVGGDGALDYVPTQIVTEYVRDALLDYRGERILGIRYRSAMCTTGVCWVIFCGPDACGNSQVADGDSVAVLRLDATTIRRFPYAADSQGSTNGRHGLGSRVEIENGS